MRVIHPACELSPRLQHLPTRIMNRCRRVITGTNDGELICNFSVFWQDFRNLKVASSRDGLEGSSYLRRCLRLHVESVQLARRTKIKDHDTRSFLFARIDVPLFRGSQILRQAQADCTQSTHLQEITSRASAARMR